MLKHLLSLPQKKMQGHLEMIENEDFTKVFLIDQFALPDSAHFFTYENFKHYHGKMMDVYLIGTGGPAVVACKVELLVLPYGLFCRRSDDECKRIVLRYDKCTVSNLGIIDRLIQREDGVAPFSMSQLDKLLKPPKEHKATLSGPLANVCTLLIPDTSEVLACFSMHEPFNFVSMFKLITQEDQSEKLVKLIDTLDWFPVGRGDSIEAAIKNLYAKLGAAHPLTFSLMLSTILAGGEDTINQLSSVTTEHGAYTAIANNIAFPDKRHTSTIV